LAQLGILERENAAVLNAALRPLANHLIPAFRAALQGLGIQAQFYLTSNDGTLMSAEAAKQACCTAQKPAKCCLPEDGLLVICCSLDFQVSLHGTCRRDGFLQTLHIHSHLGMS
jgi:hypothetical protein